MPAFLLIVRHPYRVEMLHLDAANPAGHAPAEGLTSLGSDPANQIQIPGAEPFHAQIRQSPAGWQFCDVGGAGTYIDGRLTRGETLLPTGAELRIGETRLIYAENLLAAFQVLGWPSGAPTPAEPSPVIGPTGLRSLDAVGRLAGGVAHNFNNLLQTILGYTSLAMDGLAPGDQRREDLQEVLKATENAANLTRQLSAFGGVQLLRPVDQSLAVILADIEQQLTGTLGPQVRLEIAADPQTSVVRADFKQLQKAVLALCTHACEAMPFGGLLRLTTSNVAVRTDDAAHDGVPAGDYALLTVADTSHGIPPENLAHLFEPFFTATEASEDTGLALAMVYGTVRQHNGFIHVESHPEQGTTFRVYLPVAVLPSASPQPAAEQGGLRGTETILVAEDEQHVRELAVRVLQSAGYQVLSAADGEQALEVFAARRNELNLVLLDVIMPKLGGHAVYEAIHRQCPTLPVVFSSGHSPDMLRRADDYSYSGLELLSKPYTPESLLRKVRHVLDRSRS